VYIRVSLVKMTGAGVFLDMHMHRFWCGSEAVGCQPRAFFILQIVPGPGAHQGLVQSCQARSGGMIDNDYTSRLINAAVGWLVVCIVRPAAARNNYIASTTPAGLSWPSSSVGDRRDRSGQLHSGCKSQRSAGS